MKIGLIARCETSRGLSIQSQGFYEHMPVDKVLLIAMPQPDCETDPSMYRDYIEAPYDNVNHTLPKREAMAFLDGLDVVFTVETPYDWELLNWAKELGVKTVIQGNPEFIRHGQDGYEHYPHPDQWWWPTKWRWNRLPPGIHMPVPMPDRPLSHRWDDEKPNFLHVVGKRAYADRNGTDIVINALRGIQSEVDFTISGFGWELPEDITAPKNVNLTIERVGVRDRWSMYDDHSMLVMPRHYGGLCLPALEAAACGLGVMMPDASPNDELASVLMRCQTDRVINLAAGRIQMADVSFIELAAEIDRLARSPETMMYAQEAAFEAVPVWSDWKSRYLDALEAVCEG